MQMSWARLAMIALLICGFFSGAFADQVCLLKGIICYVRF